MMNVTSAVSPTHVEPVSRRSGFTLTELLVVIAIIAILSGAISGSLLQARRNARRAKASAELRGLATAWGQWYQLYSKDFDGDWPPGLSGGTDVEMSQSNLGPVTDADNRYNPKGIVLLNVSIDSRRNPGMKYLDPWGNPYEMSFSRSSEVKSDFEITASAYLSNSGMKR